MSTFSAKQKALALLPKVSGFFSMVGSFFIFQHVLKSPKRRGLTYHRLLFGISCSDMIGSFIFFLSTWPIPAGTPGVYLAAGTTGTCSAAGFFNQFSALCTPCYNFSLSIYYILVICRGWREQDVHQIEWILHLLPLTLGMGTAITGLAMTLFNSANWLCWIAPLPTKCDVDPSIPCERGNYSWIFRWAFLYAEVWFIFVFMSFAMAGVYWTVLKHERAVEKYRRPGDKGDFRHSRKVANQAFLYVGGFYVTWIFGTLTRLLQLIKGRIYFPIIVLMTIFFPLQGFFNALVYVRPRYLKWRRKNPTLSVFAFWRDWLKDTLPKYAVNRHRTFLRGQSKSALSSKMGFSFKNNKSNKKKKKKKQELAAGDNGVVLSARADTEIGGPSSIVSSAAETTTQNTLSTSAATADTAEAMMTMTAHYGGLKNELYASTDDEVDEVFYNDQNDNDEEGSSNSGDEEEEGDTSNTATTGGGGGGGGEPRQIDHYESTIEELTSIVEM